MRILDRNPSILPPRDTVFEIMHRLRPKDIRVIMVGQSPYTDDNAGGIPLMSAKNRHTQSLDIIRKELVREYAYLNVPTDINGLIDSWVSQGVFMVNMSMTLGKSGDPFVDDHSVMWEEFVRELVTWISHRKQIPVILMGKQAWTLEVPEHLAIRVPHPNNRDNSFLGCDVFYRVNLLLTSEPIFWAKK